MTLTSVEIRKIAAEHKGYFWVDRNCPGSWDLRKKLEKMRKKGMLTQHTINQKEIIYKLT